MKKSTKWLMALIFAIPFILAIVINIIALHPWDKYSHGGPLAYPPIKGTETAAPPNLTPGIGIVFGGTSFTNTTKNPIEVISIKPVELPKNMTFKDLGVTQKKIESVLSTDIQANASKYNIKKLPFTLPAGAKDFQPVMELTPKKSGDYTLQGFVLTYNLNGKVYQEYYADQFIVHTK